MNAASAKSKRGAAKRGTARSTGKSTAASRGKAHELLRGTLDGVARRLLDERILQPGAIVFRDPLDESAVFALRTTGQRAEIVAGADADPVLEVAGDPARLKAIVEGKKDARAQFFAGGISIQGDMYYLSELGLALGFLKTPLV